MLKIARNFHFRNGKVKRLEETTYKALMEIGRCVMFEGKKFQWQMYDQGKYPIDWELMYTETDGEYFIDEVLSESPPDVKCDCGAKKVGSKRHSHWCTAYEG